MYANSTFGLRFIYLYNKADNIIDMALVIVFYVKLHVDAFKSFVKVFDLDSAIQG